MSLCVFHKAGDLVAVVSWLQVRTFSLRLLVLIDLNMAHTMQSFRCSGLFFFALFLHLLLLCAGYKKLRKLRQGTHARLFKVQRIAWRNILRIAAYFAQASEMLNEVRCDR